MKPGESDLEIYYTLDGSEVSENSEKYADPFEISSSCKITSQAYKNGELYGKPEAIEIMTHLAVGKKVDYINKFNRHYPAGGETALVDGFIGNPGNHRDKRWQAWAAEDMDLIIDLGEETEISSISMNFLSRVISWIHLPKSVSWYISDDGKKFTKLGEEKFQGNAPENESFVHKFSLKTKTKGRYLKVVAESIKVNPKGHVAPGEDAWIFCDEIVVE